MGSGCSRSSGSVSPRVVRKSSKNAGETNNETKVKEVTATGKKKATLVHVTGNEKITELLDDSGSEREVCAPKERKSKATHPRNKKAEARAPPQLPGAPELPLTADREDEVLSVVDHHEMTTTKVSSRAKLGNHLTYDGNHNPTAVNSSMPQNQLMEKNQHHVLKKMPSSMSISAINNAPAPVTLAAQTSLYSKSFPEIPAQPVTTSEILRACEIGDEQVIKKFLSAHPTRTSLLTSGLPLLHNKNTRMHALHLAAEYGHAGILQLLLEAGVPCDIDVLPYTPLGVAADKRQVEACKVLLQHGADVYAGVENNAMSLATDPEIQALFQKAPKPKRLQPLEPLSLSMKPKLSKSESPPPSKKNYTEPKEEDMFEEPEVFEGEIEDLAVSENWRHRLYAVSRLIEDPSRMQQEWLEQFMSETKQTFHAKVMDLCLVIDVDFVAPHLDELLKMSSNKSSMKKAGAVMNRLMVEKEELSDDIYARLTDDLTSNGAVAVDKWKLLSQLTETRIPHSEDRSLVLCKLVLKNIEHKKNEVRECARKILGRLPPELVRAQLEIVAPALRDKTFAKLSKQFEAPRKEQATPWLNIKDVEPLSEEVRAFASPLIPLFGEEWTACFYSRMWQARAESILGINLLLDSLPDADLDLVMRCLNEGLGDANQKVLLAAAEVVPPIVKRFAPAASEMESLRELQTQLFPIVKALCFHMGDAKELVRSGASKSLLSMASIISPAGSVMSPGTLGALILTHLSPKQNAPGFLCRLTALRDLLKQHKMFPALAQEPQIWTNLGCGMVHPDAQVRKESLRIFLIAFKINLQAVKDSVEQVKLRDYWVELLKNLQVPPKIYKELIEQIRPNTESSTEESEKLQEGDERNETTQATLEVLMSWAKCTKSELMDKPQWERLQGCLPFANEEILISLCRWITLLHEDHLINALKIVKETIEQAPVTTFELAMIIPRHLLPNLLGLDCKNTRVACSVDRLVRWLSKHKTIPKASSMVSRQVVSLIEKEENTDRCKRHLMLLEHLPIEESLVPQLLELLVEKKCELLNGPITQLLVKIRSKHQIPFPAELQNLVRHEGGVRVPLELPPLVKKREVKGDSHFLLNNVTSRSRECLSDAGGDAENTLLNSTQSSFKHGSARTTGQPGAMQLTGQGTTTFGGREDREARGGEGDRVMMQAINKKLRSGGRSRIEKTQIIKTRGDSDKDDEASTDASTISPKEDIHTLGFLKLESQKASLANVTAGPWVIGDHGRRCDQSTFRRVTR